MEEVVFKIDQREGKLKTALTERIESLPYLGNVKVVLDNLECGDFIIEYNDKIIVAFERKSWKDLLASIKDGRYRLQKDKMLSCIGREKIKYILEGASDWTGKGSGVYLDTDKKSVISSVINTQIRDGIHVMNTNGLDDTCEYLIQVLTRVSKEPTKYVKEIIEGQPVNVATKEDYITKHKINSAQDLFLYQMTQVPGISAKTAMAFVKEFDTMKGFYKEMNSVPEEDMLTRLKNIVIEDNGKKRRINSKVAENIAKYMF